MLGDFFYQDQEDEDSKKEELSCEWAKFKYKLLVLQSQLPPESTTKRSQDTLQMQNTNRVVTEAYAQHAVDLSASLPLTFRTGRGMSVIASWPMPGPGKGHLVLKS